MTLLEHHFLLELHLMLFHCRQHIVVCLIEIVNTHSDFTINSEFLEFVQ